MSKTSKPKVTKTSRNAFVVGAVFAALSIVNLFPFHYAKQHTCPRGGSYQQSGRTMGVPFSYFKTVSGGLADCSGFSGGDSTSKQFFAQALIGDAVVFGLIMMGVNLLLDGRRATT